MFYFGEDVDYYENGKVVKHDGTWHAGVNGSRAGLMMPATPKLKMKYYQEIAPGVAMDRAEIVSLDETCKTPAGTFSKCLKVKEGSAIEITARVQVLRSGDWACQGRGPAADQLWLHQGQMRVCCIRAQWCCLLGAAA
ncbi:hypothetical protein LP416_29795 [Polaromonas sp. P2-4]|nr:hypothetical protein LP416_29795 [Polaromonas sp. P2-4]